MRICLSLVHLITVISVLAQGAVAQVEPPSARIVTLTLNPHDVAVLHLRQGYVSSVRLPEKVSSVVLGDPVAFNAEHSDAEPQLVFFKPTRPKPAGTNALITTRTGHEVFLSLVSEGNSNDGTSIDYLLKYEPPRSFLIEASHSNFVISDTRSLTQQSPLVAGAPSADDSEQELIRQQSLPTPHWQGKQLRVAVGRVAQTQDRMTVTFSVLNSSAKTIELLPPQIVLAGKSKGKHGKTIKAEPVAIEDYRMTTRRLAPGARAIGIVIFERPTFKESSERLLLQVAQAEEVDRPVLAQIGFVAPAKGEAK
ncbi:MAG: hypothetical protein ACRD2U_04280 [Terriglobales bacterium]